MNSLQRTNGEDERGCFVCAKHRGEIVVPGGSIYQDELLYVGHRAPLGDGSETYLGYLMVETRRHASGVADLSLYEAQAVGEWVTRVGRALTAVVHAQHVYAFVLGDHGPHLHEHVVARYARSTRVLGVSSRRVAGCASRRHGGGSESVRAPPIIACEYGTVAATIGGTGDDPCASTTIRKRLSALSRHCGWANRAQPCRMSYSGHPSWMVTSDDDFVDWPRHGPPCIRVISATWTTISGGISRLVGRWARSSSSTTRIRSLTGAHRAGQTANAANR
jgi:histidine triad (HIT) family protein